MDNAVNGKRGRWALVAGSVWAAAAGCGGTTSGASDCAPGAERCACRPDGSCDRGLSCASGVCVEAPDDDATGGSAGEEGGNGEPAGAGAAAGPSDANPLLPEDGYIQGGGADGRIWGAWYTFGYPDCVFNPPEGEPVYGSNGAICFSGTVAQIIGWGVISYGVEIGFDLCGMPADMTTCEGWMPPEFCDWAPYSKHTVSECGISLNTISFDITGTLPSTELRINFKEAAREESAYLVVADTGPFSGNVADAAVQYDSGAPPLDPTRVEAIHFQATPTTAGSVDFDFCISNLQIE
jgi:hypothetical protein